MGSQKGQVVVFIIVGIVILIAVAAYLYLQREELSLPDVEDIPEEFLPVREYVEECVRIVATQGVAILGVQGGYITIPAEISANPFSSLALTEGNSGDPSSELRLPYWYYEGRNRVPTVDMMSEQLSSYIDQNIKHCLGSMDALQSQFDLEVVGEPSSATAIGKSAVTVVTKLPIRTVLKGSDKVMIVESYKASMPVELRRMHELAAEIMETENKETFFENLTINLMAIGPDIPFTDLELHCGKLKWYKPQVQRDIQGLLFYNIPRVAIEKTGHPAIPPSDDLGRHMFTWHVTGKDFRDITAGVLFSRDWPFDMHVRPSVGDVMPASYGEGISEYLPFLCINAYHFTYDITYPIQVVLQDPDAFNGDGYTFMFAFPVMINHNRADRVNVPISVFDTPLVADEACASRDPDPVAIRVTDTMNEYIKGVNVTFDCMGMVQCPLGETRFNAGIHSLTTTIPRFCTPGMLQFQHKKYLPTSVSIDRTKRSFDVVMTPLKSLSLRVQKKQLRGSDLVGSYDLDDGQYAILFMTAQGIPDYTVYRRFPTLPEAQANAEQKTIPLIVQEGTSYDVDIMLLDKDDTFIGGYRGNWTPSVETFIERRSVTFTVMEQVPHPSAGWEDQLEVFDKLEQEELTSQIPPLFES